jgi:hypothetical protein
MSAHVKKDHPMAKLNQLHKFQRLYYTETVRKEFLKFSSDVPSLFDFFPVYQECNVMAKQILEKTGRSKGYTKDLSAHIECSIAAKHFLAFNHGILQLQVKLTYP